MFLRDDAESMPDNIFSRLRNLEEIVDALSDADIELPAERLAILDE